MVSKKQLKIRDNLKLRAKIIQLIRDFFNEKDYLEVETPYRIPFPIPESNIDFETSEDWFLHTSPELYLKKLLSIGYNRLYQICKCFRKNERGSKHLPEFTLLEWYCIDINYLDMMDITKSLILYISQKLGLGNLIKYQGNIIDLGSPWKKITVNDAFEKFGSISMDKAIEKDLFDEIIAIEIEPKLNLSSPVFLYDYPSSKGGFAKIKSDNPLLRERFELYIGGLELCNAYSEITDRNEQIKLILKEQDNRKKNNKKDCFLSKNFIESIPNIPESSGNALGVDRLVMIFADTDSIDEVVSFCF